MATSDWLYLAGDVDAIKDFVLETSSLPQIRGGSELLLDCEEEIKKLQKEYGYEVVYCGGGTFLLSVPADRADRIKEAIEALYRHKTLVATVTIVHEGQLPSADPGAGQEDLDGWAGRLLRATPLTGRGFAWRVARLQARLREAKDERRHVPFYQALPFGQRCTRCGKRMAAQERERLDERLCPVCYLRDDTGRSRSKTIHGLKVRGRFNQEFWEQHGQDITAEQPEDLDQLVEEAPRKYLAFLYADGNDIGRLLHGVEGQEHYKALSQALTEGTKAAVYRAIRAIREVCLPLPPRLRWWPFHILNVGGDDVMVLMQAGYAWEVAVRFLELFEEEVTRRAREALVREGRDWPGHWPQRIGASCAVVIADAKYPIRYMERLASDLLSKAKRLAKEKSTSAVTFLWLPTPVASEWAEPLLATFAYETAPEERAELLSRPYTLSQARQLQECVARIASWPRSLRHRWQEALRQGVFVSTALIAYDIGRQRGQRAEVIELLDRICADSGDGQQPLLPPVWRRLPPAAPGDKMVWKTALFDALQLAELQAMRPNWREEAAG